MPPLRINRWSPDTCRCVLEIEADATRPEGVRLVQVINTCPEHASLPDQALYDAVVEENRRKNYTLAETQEAEGITPAQQAELTRLQGEAQEAGIPIAFLLSAAQQQALARMQQLVSGYRWSFGPGRVLTVSFPGINRPSLQARLDARFGPGRVILA